MNCVVIRKTGGFYQVFDNDAIIINYLCDYKIVNGRVGFPLNSIDKVVNLLMENKISYCVKEGMKEVDSKEYNKYIK